MIDQPQGMGDASSSSSVRRALRRRPSCRPTSPGSAPDRTSSDRQYLVGVASTDPSTLPSPRRAGQSARSSSCSRRRQHGRERSVDAGGGRRTNTPSAKAFPGWRPMRCSPARDGARRQHPAFGLAPGARGLRRTLGCRDISAGGCDARRRADIDGVCCSTSRRCRSSCWRHRAVRPRWQPKERVRAVLDPADHDEASGRSGRGIRGAAGTGHRPRIA